MIRLPLAKIEKATDSTVGDTGPKKLRALTNVYFDGVKSRLIATDGYIVAIIPVKSVFEDKSGNISPGAISVAREMGSHIRLHQDKLIVESERLGIASLPRPKDNYPIGDIERALATIDGCEARAVVVLDVKRLLQLAEALLDFTDWHCGLKLHVRGKNDPVMVEPHSPHHDDRLGIIMPMLGEDSTPSGTKYR